MKKSIVVNSNKQQYRSFSHLTINFDFTAVVLMLISPIDDDDDDDSLYEQFFDNISVQHSIVTTFIQHQHKTSLCVYSKQKTKQKLLSL